MSGEQSQPSANRPSDFSQQPIPGISAAVSAKDRRPFSKDYANYGIILAYIALVVGLLSAYGGFVFTRNVNRTHAQEAFERRKEEMAAYLDKQLSLYLSALQGFKGLYAASKSVERDEFNAYARGIKLQENFPGLLAVQYTQRVEAKDLEAYVAAVKSDTSVRPEGFPNFHVHPEGDRAEYLPVTYIETRDPAVWSALGYDVGFESRRRAAADAARDSGQATAAGPLALILDPNNRQPAFLVFLPVYRNKAPRKTVPERRDALEGYILGVFRAQDFFSSLLASLGTVTDIDLEIFDGLKPKSETALFDSNDRYLEALGPLRGHFRSVSELSMAGRTWTLVVHAPTNYGLSRFEQWLPLGALVVGLVLSILGFLVVYGLATARSRALSLASRMSAEARSCEVYFRALINHAQDIITIIEPNGLVRFESPAIERVLGYTPEEMVGKNVFDFMHPDDKARTLATVASAVPFPGAIRKAIFRYHHKDGRWRVLEAIGANQLFDPAVRGLVINSRDVTDREEAQRLIQESFARYSGLVANIPGAVFRCACDSDWAMEFVSDAIEVISGYPAREFTDKKRSYASLIHPEDRLLIERTVLNAVERSEPFSLEYRITNANGSLRWVEMQGRGSSKEQGRGIFLDGVIFDVTKRKTAEERLQEADERLKSAQAQLFQSEKLASIGQLAAGVAHEVKNPLAIILQGVSYFDTLPAMKEAEPGDILEMMRKAVSRADRIIRELLDFARPSAMAIVAVSLQPLIESSLELVKAQLRGSQIAVSMNIEPGLPAVKVDENQMRQVLVNLILNAFQAMPNGGTLTIRAYARAVKPEELSRSHRVANTWHQERLGAWVEIIDTGTGIPKHLINRIWDPFFTTKPAGQGTGLGLSVTQSILDAHDGLLFVESEEGRGTKVVIVLPLEGGMHG